jgi:hypothetical protein
MTDGKPMWRMVRAAAAAAMAVAVLHSQAARAEAMRPEQALAALFAAPATDGAFAPAFLARLPPAQVTQIVAGLRREYGPLGGVEAAADGFTLRFARARIPARISLRRAHRRSLVRRSRGGGRHRQSRCRDQGAAWAHVDTARHRWPRSRDP